jgi:hypothetical protein
LRGYLVKEKLKVVVVVVKDWCGGCGWRWWYLLLKVWYPREDVAGCAVVWNCV